MSSADVFIALGVPTVVAAFGLSALAAEQFREMRKVRLARQRIEIRLAFGDARAELFRLAVEGHVHFNSPLFRTLYGIDSTVMRDLSSHATLADACSDAFRAPMKVPDGTNDPFEAFARAPATARCAQLHALAIRKLWFERSLLAQRLRMLPPFMREALFSAASAGVKTSGTLLAGAKWVVRWKERWQREQEDRPGVEGLFRRLDPNADAFGVC